MAYQQTQRVADTPGFWTRLAALGARPSRMFGDIPMLRITELQEQLTYRDLIGRYLIDRFGCVHAFNSIDAPAADVASVDLLVELQKALSDVMIALPQSIVQAQYSYIRNGDYRDVITGHMVAESSFTHAARLRKLRGERLLDQVTTRRLNRSSTLLVFTCGPKDESKEGAAILEQFRQHQSSVKLPSRYLKPVEFEEAVHTLRTAELVYADAVKHVGIAIAPLSGLQIGGFFYRLMNPDLAIDMGLNPGWDPDKDSFFSAWLHSDVEIKDNCLKWGDYYHAIVTLGKEPAETRPRDIERITTDLDFSDFRVTLGIRRTEREQMYRLATSRRRGAFGRIKIGTDPIEAASRKTANGDGMGQMLAEEMNEVDAANEIILKLKKNNIYIAHCQMVVHLWHRDRAELNRRREIILSRIGDMSRAKGFREAHALKWIFLNSLPATYQPFLRPRNLEDKMMADFIPLHKGYEGSGDPIVLLKNTKGGLVSFDLFDRKEAPNSLVFVSGAAGAGKSTLVNLLIEESMVLHPETKQRPLLLILDVGGSYKPMIELLGGKYIEFNPDHPICINPLQTASRGGRVVEPSGFDRVRLMRNLEALCYSPSDPGGVLPPNMFRLLDTCVTLACNRAAGEGESYVCLSGLMAELREHSSEVGAMELLDRLAPYVGDTYGKWFDGPTQLDAEEEVVCFDLKGIKNMPPLVRGMIPLIINFMYDAVMNNPGRRKILPLDEFWSYALSPNLIDFFVEVFKTIRKEDGAPIGISQALKDAGLSEKLEIAIVQNTSTWFLLDQGKQEYRDHAVKLLHLTEGEAELLGNLRSANRKDSKGRIESYREVLMVRTLAGGNKSGVCRIELMPEQHWTFTTDPEERNLRARTVEQFDGNLWKAVEFLASKHPGGLHLKSAEF